MEQGDGGAELIQDAGDFQAWSGAVTAGPEPAAATGAGVAVVGLLAGALTPQDLALSVVLYALVLCIPLGIAVAVLRYRLWGLDRLVSRTVTYTLVTGLVVLLRSVVANGDRCPALALTRALGGSPRRSDRPLGGRGR